MSQPIPKDWMNEIDRFGIVYKQGVSDFIQFASDKDPTSTRASGDLNGGDESEGGDLEPPYVLEPDLGKRYNEYKQKRKKNYTLHARLL
ncbi:hypothetical protein IFM89_035711 [Coptis chinensis]|uniref:Uncharacterized protein n=1 Tax=Coptis chinensis TaxID=261450 RepID=A0A835IRW8_9MAGN|nr:hypothetical protein IFM89_035711 [Coptis chinensis]